jgi:hypothetical protein
LNPKEVHCEDFLGETFRVSGYQQLLTRAIDSVLEPITGTNNTWLTQADQLVFDLFSLQGDSSIVEASQ